MNKRKLLSIKINNSFSPCKQTFNKSNYDSPRFLNTARQMQISSLELPQISLIRKQDILQQIENDADFQLIDDSTTDNDQIMQSINESFQDSYKYVLMKIQRIKTQIKIDSKMLKKEEMRLQNIDKRLFAQETQIHQQLKDSRHIIRSFQ